MKKFISLFILMLASVSMAATNNLTAQAINVMGGNTRSVTFTHDFSDATLASNGVIQAISLGAKSFVHAISLDVVTASASAGLMSIGDGSDTDGWLAATTLTNAAGFSSAAVATVSTGTNFVSTVSVDPAYGFGKLYTSADTIDLRGTTTTITNGVIRVRAVITDLSK